MTQVFVFCRPCVVNVEYVLHVFIYLTLFFIYLDLLFCLDNPKSWHRLCAKNGEKMDLLRALSTFNRITETGSFSAVARETNSSHSAVTRLISQLEAHFGVRLFGKPLLTGPFHM